MKWIKQRVMDGELLAGVFLNLGVGCAAEIAGRAGFDWVLLDTEHGLGAEAALVEGLQGARAGDVCPIVRVLANEAGYFKRALDAGAAGIMVPHINKAEDARRAVQHMKYPPEGARGLSRSSRATAFGYDAAAYFRDVGEGELLVVQIETKEAVEQIDGIAAVPGVDVLFVGPADLSFSCGVPCDLDHPVLRAALEKVAQAARQHGKRTGIFLRDAEQLAAVAEAGFTLIALDTDLGILKAGLENTARTLGSWKKPGPPSTQLQDPR
jgi:4-hydroxy-2-oxoheptanedioate aldolase